MARTLCKYCCMQVGALAPSCPRCRRRWPGVRARSLRGVTLRVAFVCGVVALVFFLWQPLLAK